MPKRRHSEEFELEYLKWKNKKLEGELNRKRSRKHKRRHRSRSTSRDKERSRSISQVKERSRSHSRNSKGTETANDGEGSHVNHENIFDKAEQELENQEIPAEIMDIDAEGVNNVIAENNNEVETSLTVDPELLEILGADPSAKEEYGKDINPELASRLQYIATAGLTKEARKELNDKFLIPGNSVKIGAPSMNPEIKAAVTETIVKRDKGIEARQKQLAAAISGLAVVVNNELESKNKDSGRSKQLMDVCRILCDIQHSESVTRRNFAIFSIKKELKEHLIHTKIDKYLFGENLNDTLKSAKAVTKSGTELKTKPMPKPKPPTPIGNLNWKSPAPARKLAPGAGRGREVAPPPAPGPAMRYTRNKPHASSSKTSYLPSKQTRRR